MVKRFEKSHSVQQMFVILVLALFMVFSMLMVVLGATCYVRLEDKSAFSNQTRILRSFVRSSLCVQEDGGNVLVEGDRLIIENRYDDEVYRQYIYVHEGQLRQQFISAERVFSPENGDSVCPAAVFSPRLEGNMLIVEMEDSQGRGFTLYEAVKTMDAKGGGV